MPAILEAIPVMTIPNPKKSENFLPFASARPGNRNIPIMHPKEYID